MVENGLKLDTNWVQRGVRVSVTGGVGVYFSSLGLQGYTVEAPVDCGGALYIVNSEGTRVSSGFESFDTLTIDDNQHDQKLTLLLGKIGGGTCILRLSTAETTGFDQSQFFHEIKYRMDLGGRLVKTTGATSSIINDRGEQLSRGYHDIFMKRGRMFGRIGAIEEVIVLLNPEESQQT